MRFGLINSIFFCTLIVAISSCNDPDNQVSFATPMQGDNVNVGNKIEIKLAAKGDIESVSYLLDGKLIATKENFDPITLETADLPLGYRLITAILKQGNHLDTLQTNIVLKTDKAPLQLRYKVVKAFPHDTSSYTQGLNFVDASLPGGQGKILESTGEKGSSVLQYVDLNSGKSIKKVKLDPQYFGEGSVKIDNRIIMLTWLENTGLIFDAQTLKQLGSFPYERSREGWGLTYDGKQLLRSDGTNRVWKMNAKTYKEEGFIEVYDHKGPVAQLNELEFIEGKIYANVYLSNKIVRIDPKSGLIDAEIDLSALVPQHFFKTTAAQENNVLNGIAWDAKGKRLFVGGKKWPKLYEIKLLP